MISLRFSVALLALTATACPHNPYTDELFMGDPIATRSSVIWPDHTHHELLIATPQDDNSLAVAHVPVGSENTQMLWAVPSTVGDAVLCMLAPASEKVEGVDTSLVRVTPDSDTPPVEVPLVAPFSAISQAPGRPLAVLHFGGGNQVDALQNANQVAIVDLETHRVRDLTLNGFGSRLRSVQFPRPDDGDAAVQVGSARRELIAFLAEGEVVLVDARDPDADQVAVRFGQDAPFEPAATLLRPGDDLFGSPALFLRSDVSSDAAMLTLVEHRGETTGAPGFSARINLIPVGDGAADFLTYDSESAPYLVSVKGQNLAFTDIRTQQGFSLTLSSEATRLLMRDHTRAGGTQTPQLVAWAMDSQTIYQLDLDDIEVALGRRPTRLHIETGVHELVILDNDRALVGSGTTLYVVNFALGQVTPLTSATAYDAHASSFAGDRLLLGTPGQSRISTVDLETLDPQSMALDEPISAFFHLRGVGKMLVVHDDASGEVTVTDESPLRSTSVTSSGLFFDHELERH